jgi:hypothetical protein
MSRHNHHPHSEMLDRLRSGLLDDQPDQKAELEAHLQSCQQCRQRYDWHGYLGPDTLEFPGHEKRLHQARQRALASAPRKTLRRFAPLAAAAAIALVAVLVTSPLRDQEDAETRLAGTNSSDIPEVYEELDFYLWLADHKDTLDSST